MYTNCSLTLHKPSDTPISYVIRSPICIRLYPMIIIALSDCLYLHGRSYKYILFIYIILLYLLYIRSILLMIRIGYCTICIQLSCGKLILLRSNQNALNKLSLLLMYSKHQDQGKFIQYLHIICIYVQSYRESINDGTTEGSNTQGLLQEILSYTSLCNCVEKSVNNAYNNVITRVLLCIQPRDNMRKSLFRIRIILV